MSGAQLRMLKARILEFDRMITAWLGSISKQGDRYLRSLFYGRRTHYAHTEFFEG